MKLKRENSLINQGRSSKFLIVFILTFVVAKGFGIAFTKIFTNVLDQNEMGQYQVVISAISLILSFSAIGFPTALNRYAIRYKTKNQIKELKDFIFSGFIIFIILEFLILVTLLILYYSFSIKPWFLQVEFYVKTLFLIAIVVLTQFINTMCYVISSSLQNSKYYGIIMVMRILLQIPFGMLFVLKYDLGPFGLIFGLAVSESLVAVYSMFIIISDIGIGKFSFKELKKILEFSLPVYVNGFLMMGFNLIILIYVIYVDPINGNNTIALYNYGALSVVNLILLAGNVFRMVYRPIVYKYYERNQYNEMIELTVRVLKIFLILIFFLAIFIFAFSPLLIQFFTQSSYLPSLVAIPILLISVIFTYLPNIISYGHSLYFKNYWNLIASLTSLLLASLVGYFIIPKNGLLGISFAYLTLRFFYFIGLTIISQQYFRIKYDIKLISKIILAIIVSILIGIFLYLFAFNFLDIYTNIIISFSISGIGFVAIIFVSKIITKDDFQFLKNIFNVYIQAIKSRINSK